MTDEFSIYTAESWSDSYIQFYQQELEVMHDAMWNDGKYHDIDVTQLMQGGLYLAAQNLAQLDLNTTLRNDTDAGPTNILTYWIENMLVADLIGTWFQESAEPYVVYVPYGQVKGLTKDNAWEDFTRQDCVNKWITNSPWNIMVLATCEDSGMGVLWNWRQDPTSSWEQGAGYSYNGYVFEPRDMINSSIKSFLAGGFT